MKYILLALISVILLNAQEDKPAIDLTQHAMWGFCSEKTNSEQQYIWIFGKSHCENSYKFGYHDWRLPTPQEFQKSVKNGTLKSIRPGSYWTSKADPKDPEDNVLSVYSTNGHVSPLDLCDEAYALCVR